MSTKPSKKIIVEIMRNDYYIWLGSDRKQINMPLTKLERKQSSKYNK